MKCHSIETTSTMNNTGINISYLSILLRKLRHKIGAKSFEPETKMNDLCGEMITPQSGEYRYIHEFGNILELILY